MDGFFSLLSLVFVVATRYIIVPKVLGLGSNGNILQYLDVLFNTPFISYKTLKECIFMSNYSSDLKGGTNLNQLPLYVNLFKAVPESMHFYLFCLFDAGSFYYIMQIVNKSNEKQFSKKTTVKLAVYLLNPLTYINLLMKTEFVVIQFCLILSLYHIQRQKHRANIILAALFISLATYLDIYNLGLSLILMNFTSNHKLLFIAAYGCIVALLMGSSYLIQPMFISNNIVSKVLFKEQYPNIGLWWYFFIEIFQEYRDFFKFVFNCYCYIFVVPVFVRFKAYPLQAFAILFTWITAFKPYPTIGELGFILIVFVYWFDMRIIENKLIIALLVIHSLILLPIFYHLWITIGSGNSNFFYALTLVYVVSLVLILLSMVKAVLYLEYEENHASTGADQKYASDGTNEKEEVAEDEKKLKLVCVP